MWPERETLPMFPHQSTRRRKLPQVSRCDPNPRTQGRSRPSLWGAQALPWLAPLSGH